MKLTKHYSKQLSILLFFIAPFSLTAQLCWESPKQKDCRTTLISEAGLSVRVTDQDLVFGRLDNDIGIGLKRKIGDRMAIGGLAFANLTITGERNFHTGIRARLSYRLNDNLELNLSPGVILYDDGFDGDGFKGVSLEGDISWNRTLAFYGRFTSQNFPYDEQKVSILNLGIKTKGKKSVYVTGGLLLVQGIILGTTFF